MTYPLQIDRWIMVNNVKKMEKERIYVKIKKGADSGEIIIIREKGNIINETLKGDIKLFIKVENKSKFKREGLNLKHQKSFTLKESLTGFKFDIKHLNGKTYTINNDSGNIIPANYKKEIDNQKNLWWKVHKEDHEICERLQQGRSSPVASGGGLLSPHWENSVRAFHKIVIKSMKKSLNKRKR